MFRGLRHALFSTAMVVLLATPAAAELTARDAWEGLQRSVGAVVRAVGVESSVEGTGSLTLSGVMIEFDVDGAPDPFRATLPEIRLREQPDGTVAIATPTSFPVTLAGTNPDTGEAVSATMTIRLSGADIIASRQSGETRYVLPGDEAFASVEDIVVADVPLDVGLAAEARGFAESYVAGDGDTGSVSPGEADLTLTGALAFLNRLVDAGLLPQTHAFSAVFMLGLFARQGDGPDTFVSRVEVGSDGSVTANGQRFR